jgi:hypothetical protein
VVAAAKDAARVALAAHGSAIHVDQLHGNAYPQSLLFDDPH